MWKWVCSDTHWIHVLLCKSLVKRVQSEKHWLYFNLHKIFYCMHVWNWETGYFTTFACVPFVGPCAAAEPATMSLSVLPRAPEQCIYTLSSAGTGIPSRVCLSHPPYGGLSLVFCCPGASEGHQTPESNFSTALALLYCDISLSGQSDKSHMASPHERTTAASSRCCCAHWPWSGKLGFQDQ